MEVYIARQPIFDRDYNVVAYELLYRDSLDNYFKGNISDNVATSILLINSFFNFGIENLVGDARAFINFDKHLINHGVAELLNKDSVTIEILETVEPDHQFMRNIKGLKEKGYTIALDDYVIDYPYPQLVEEADLIKVDFMESSNEEIESIVRNLKSQDKKLLAEKVETKEEYEWARTLGFHYFQGYYFAKPAIQRRKSLDQNGLQYVKLMGELNTEVPDFRKLSNIILVDVSLTYKLLKLVNAYAKPRSPIGSVQQAIAVLGVKSFKRWLSLAMVQTMAGKETNELVKSALIRSSLLNRIAEHSNMKRYTDELALLGTLSILDAILEMDMVDALEKLPIEDNLKATLLGDKTLYSDAMQLCLAYEKGVFDQAEVAAKNIEYELSLLPEHYVEAISWSDKMFRELKTV